MGILSLSSLSPSPASVCLLHSMSLCVCLLFCGTCMCVHAHVYKGQWLAALPQTSSPLFYLIDLELDWLPVSSRDPPVSASHSESPSTHTALSFENVGPGDGIPIFMLTELSSKTRLALLLYSHSSRHSVHLLRPFFPLLCKLSVFH